MAHDYSHQRSVLNPCQHSHRASPLNDHHFFYVHRQHHHHHHHNHHRHHHHHHHHHYFPLCPSHHDNHFHCHHLVSQKIAPTSLPIPEPIRSNFPIQNAPNGHSGQGQAHASASLILQEHDFQQPEDEDDEPIFVLTDEWREFFAESESRRQLSKKKQGKKGKR